jgi:hypothetical protein
MNPYETPTRLIAIPVRAGSIRYFVTAVFLTLVGLAIAFPTIAMWASNRLLPAMSTRRYATYDPEFYVFGISLTPEVAQRFTLGLAFLLIAFSGVLVLRGWQLRKRAKNSAGGQ